MHEPSYIRHIGRISHTWEGSGLYGRFINGCRLAAWRCAIEKHQMQCDRVLDFGCSNGSWAKNWKSLGLEVTIGVDVNPEAVKEASERLTEAHVGGPDFLASNFSEALVSCNAVLVHVLEEDEVSRVFLGANQAVAHEGYFVASVLNPDFYITQGDFKPWNGPLSCTRPLEFHEQCAREAGFKVVDRVGTFINPWFCPETVFIANSEELKADEELFQAFTSFSNTMRCHGEIRPFSELLLVCQKP